jgi:hypothetical protein
MLAMIGALIHLLIWAIEQSFKTPPPLKSPADPRIGPPGMPVAKMPASRLPMPRIQMAKTARTFTLPLGHALLLTDIKADGPVQYSHIMAVQTFEGVPCMFVAAENNTAASLGHSGSHCLSVFTIEGYENLGASDDYADLERFQAEAVRLVKGYLNLP